MDLGNFVEAIDIDDETRDAILEEEVKALNILGMNQNDKPEDIVSALRKYIDSLLENDTIKDYSDEEKRDLAVTLGSAWGMAVCKSFNWLWQGLRRADEDDAAFFIVSPSRKYCCPPFGFIYNIIKGDNLGLDDKNDNTVILLFNMLSEVDLRPNNSNYTVLM